MRFVRTFGLGSVFVFLACGGSESTPQPTVDAAPDVATIDASTADASTSDTGAPNDAAADAVVVDAAGDAVVDAGVILPQGLLTPVPYVKKADSPFTGVKFPSYFHFEDFEDGLLNTMGVTSDVGTHSKPFGNLVDSVDEDDGAVDGKCGSNCDSWFFGNGVSGITFTFDAIALGSLPTHVGIVWTDGGASCDMTFTAYDASNAVIGTKTLTQAGDAQNTGQVAEDRFFGVVASGGVKAIKVTNTSGGIEVDHLQYGR